MIRNFLPNVCVFAIMLAVCLTGCKDDDNNPAPDPEVPTVAVIGVTLNKTELTLAIGADETLTATVAPDNAADKSVTWHSDNEAAATVDNNGKVTAVAPGTATITAKSTNGKEGACVITVPNHGSEYGIETVLITKGTFTMGSPADEANRSDNEIQHKVTLTKDIWMSAYAITNAQYAAFLNAEGIGNPAMAEVGSYGSQTLLTASSDSYDFGLHWNTEKWEPVSGYENYPVVYVTWYGATAYAAWVGGSLPTEAQWEYACRAGTTTAYSFGNDAADFGDYGWYSGNNTPSGTKAVGQKEPNAWDLYDMHGNVFEWCADWYDDEYGNGNADATDPKGADTGGARVLRSGLGGSLAHDCRSAFRSGNRPDFLYGIYGLRVVFVP